MLMLEAEYCEHSTVYYLHHRDPHHHEYSDDGTEYVL